MRLPPQIKTDLEATCLPWKIENGSKHLKVLLNGRLVAVMSHGKYFASQYAIKRVSARIRNATITGEGR